MTPLTRGSLQSLTIAALFVAVGIPYAHFHLPVWLAPGLLALVGFGVLLRAWWREQPTPMQQDATRLGKRDGRWAA